jgi:hypothetical protein
VPGIRSFRQLLAAASAVCLMGSACAKGSDRTTGSSDGAASPSASAAAAPSPQIQMLEYGFAVSGPAVQGGTMRLTNTGQELHMMALGRLKEGKAATDIPPALQAAMQSEDEAAFDTALSAIVDEENSPYQGVFGRGTVDVPVDVAPGSYALICFMPAVGDGLPHALKGMVNQLQVTQGQATAAPEPTATYKVAAGKAIEGPATLKSGRNVLAIEAAEGSKGLEPGLGMLAPGKAFGDLDSALSALFEGEQAPQAGYLDKLPGKLHFGLFDLGDAKKIWVALDLEPGTYVMVANDTDVENPPKSPPEQITITVS